jgi:flagellar hook-associated protein 1 FlgK
VVIAPDLNDLPITATGGKLGGLLHFLNVGLPEVQQRLDTFASELIRAIDGIHATGVGTAGPLTELTSRRPVSDPNQPLASAGLDYPPQAGTLWIGVTDLATGSRELHEITVDPATTTLNSLETAIRGVPNVQAAVTSDGTLRISANPGYGFDFAGGYDVTSTVLTGTNPPVPQMSGFPDRASNDEFTFTFLGDGTVGQTTGLMVEVKDQSGNVVATRNVGEGYTPDSVLDVADGVVVRFSAGDVKQRDHFVTQVVSQPDKAGILTALGLNTFFVGGNASSIGVNPDLENPDRLATSRTGAVGDSSNVRRLAALRDTPLLSGGKQTLSGFFTEMVTDVGNEVQDLAEIQTTQELLGERLESERQSISGVDPNEELVRLLQFQRMFQAAAEHIRIVNEAFDAVFEIVR